MRLARRIPVIELLHRPGGQAESMMEPIETLLFDFGGTLDADGVAWKERFHTLYRSEGLDMSRRRIRARLLCRR